MSRSNDLNKSSVRSVTCKGYDWDTARVFTLRCYPSQVDSSDARCWTGSIIHNLEREEDIAKQHKPLDGSIHTEIKNLAAKAETDSLEEVPANVLSLATLL